MKSTRTRLITTKQQFVLAFVIWRKTNLQRKRATLLSSSLRCMCFTFEKNDVDLTGNSYDVTKLLSFVTGPDSHLGMPFACLPFERTNFFHAIPELRSSDISERPFERFIIFLDLHTSKQRKAYNFHGRKPGRTRQLEQTDKSRWKHNELQTQMPVSELSFSVKLEPKTSLIRHHNYRRLVSISFPIDLV